MSELNLVLLGPPGSGKGTQGERLQEDLRLPYYATGDILRAAVREDTEIGREAKEYMDRGDLVPDDVIVGVIAERIVPQGGRGRFHPRRLPAHRAARPRRSARSWSGSGAPSLLAVLIDVDDDEVVRTARRAGGPAPTATSFTSSSTRPRRRASATSAARRSRSATTTSPR